LGLTGANGTKNEGRVEKQKRGFVPDNAIRVSFLRRPHEEDNKRGCSGAAANRNTGQMGKEKKVSEGKQSVKTQKLLHQEKTGVAPKLIGVEKGVRIRETSVASWRKSRGEIVFLGVTPLIWGKSKNRKKERSPIGFNRARGNDCGKWE